MSHLKHRKANNCLNCGTTPIGNYCHNCGQENLEPRETVWHLIAHLFNDITHFDGKFFSTSKYLLFKPGFLSAEYSRGKRMSYINPIRMYLFTSAFFFLIFFWEYQPNFLKVNEGHKYYASTKTLIENQIASLHQALKAPGESEPLQHNLNDKIHDLESDLNRLKTDTTHLDQLNYYRKDFDLLTTDYSSIAQYDSIQATLPSNAKDGWLKKKFRIKEIEIKDRYGNDTQLIVKTLAENFMHKFPQMFFVSLPFFAFILRMLYWKRKNFYYTDHFIYSIHLYCAVYLLLLARMLLSSIAGIHYLGWVRYLNIGLLIYMFYYLYRSMRSFYQASRGKTIAKYILLLFLTLILMLALMIGYFTFSVFSV